MSHGQKPTGGNYALAGAIAFFVVLVLLLCFSSALNMPADPDKAFKQWRTKTIEQIHNVHPVSTSPPSAPG
jgi:hypothetical protein